VGFTLTSTYYIFHLQKCTRFQPLTDFLNTVCPSVRILVEFETQSLLHLENSANTETIIQLHMQDILPTLHIYLTAEYLTYIILGKFPFSLPDYRDSLEGFSC
jgi:hypothetical protein